MEYSAVGFQRLLAAMRARASTIVLVTVLAVVATLILSLRAPVKYRSTAELIIEFDDPVESLGGSSLAPALQPNYMSTQLGIISSRHVAGRVVDQLDLTKNEALLDAYIKATDGNADRREWMASALLGGLEVTPGQNSRIVRVTYTAGDPAMAAQIANAFAAAYETTKLEMNTRPAQREAEQYQEWLAELRRNVEKAQNQLSAFQQDKGILLVDERLDLETTRLGELIAQRVLSEAEVRAIEARHRRMQELRTSGESLETMTEVLTSDSYRVLKEQIDIKEAELADASRDLGKNHPRHKQLATELSVLRNQLEREIATIAASLDNEELQARLRAQAFKDAEEAQKAKILELKRQRDEVPALVRELESAQANYDHGLATYNAVQAQGRASTTNVTLLNPALEPLKPSSPRIARNLAIATLLGLLLGIAIALLAEFLNRRVRTADEVEELLEAKLLGALPAAK